MGDDVVHQVAAQSQEAVSRDAAFEEARNPAPMRVPDRLTAKVTVKIFEAAASALRINSLEGS